MVERSGQAGAAKAPGAVAVMTIRSLDDVEAGARRFRVNWTSAVLERRQHTRTVVGLDALEAEVYRWLAEVIGSRPPHADRLDEVGDL